MKYFKMFYETEEELKKEFCNWCKRLHPDNGGSNEEFVEMQKEFTNIFENVKGKHRNKDGNIYQEDKKQYYNCEDFIIKIKSIIKYNIDIDIIGRWLWVSGNTKEIKELLKQLKFNYSGQKQAWYYHEGKYRKKSSSNDTLEELKEKYKSHNIKEIKKIA